MVEEANGVTRRRTVMTGMDYKDMHDVLCILGVVC